MKLSRVATMIVGAALGTFAVVWLVRRRRMPAEPGIKKPESSTWIRLD